MRIAKELLDEMATLAEQAWEADAGGEGYEISIKSRAGGDVRAFTQLMLLLTPPVVLNLIDDSRDTDTSKEVADNG